MDYGKWFPVFGAQALHLERNVHPSHDMIGGFVDWGQKVEFNALRLAFRDSMNRYDALRLVFRRYPVWQQRVLERQDEWQVGLIDHTSVNAAGKTKFLQTTASEIIRSFDIEAHASVRLVLFKDDHAGTDKILLLVNHLVADGYGLMLLMNYLRTRYDEYVLSGSRHIYGIDVAPSIAAYAEWLRERALSDRLLTRLEHWSRSAKTQRLRLRKNSRAPSPELYEVQRTGHVYGSIDKEVVKAFSDIVEERHAMQLADAFPLVFLYCVSKTVGSGLFPICLINHGRDCAESNLDLSETVGFLAIHLPINIHLNKYMALDPWLSRAKREMFEARAHAHDFCAAYFGDNPVDDHCLAEIAELRRSEFPEISFNFGGVVNPISGDASSDKETAIADMYSKHNRCACAVEIKYSISDCGMQVHLRHLMDEYEAFAMEKLLTDTGRIMREFSEEMRTIV